MRRRGEPLDYFGNRIERGDRFFYGNPAIFGRVLRITGGTLMLEIGIDYKGQSQTMRVKSPMYGICLDKVPDDVC